MVVGAHSKRSMELLELIGSVPWSCCFSLEAFHGVVVSHWKRLMETSVYLSYLYMNVLIVGAHWKHPMELLLLIGSVSTGVSRRVVPVNRGLLL